jgi:hypothetical protein
MSSRLDLGQMEFSLTLFFAGPPAVEFPLNRARLLAGAELGGLINLPVESNRT